MEKRIYLGTDHAGYPLKEEVKAWLIENGFAVSDMGAFELDPEDNYPEFIKGVAVEIDDDPINRVGIIFGGSGQGEAMVANRYPNVRAAVLNCNDLSLVPLCREHNDANVLSIGARFVRESVAIEAVKCFLETPFSNEERHIRRLNAFNTITH
ncbi:MAG: ribose-5-phosphate isomerase [Parcubacteria group bacterium]|nr:ribose-5-phosphate isomerase [Parcubacteria group bacterium]|tara:strand:+ start:110 stop:568 length:459 start_codon:yes stop_codon:yes gene_type:complete